MVIAAYTDFLSAYPLLRTSNLDEARQTVTEKFCDHKLVMSSRHDDLEVTHNHVSGSNVSINYLHYGASVQIDPGMLEKFYLLQIPLSGSAFVRHRQANICASNKTATLLNPDRETHMHWQGDCRKLLLQINKDFMQKIAEGLIGVPTPGPIRFDPLVDLTRAAGQIIKGVVVQTARLAGNHTLFNGGNAAQDRWVETELVTTLLNNQNSNISHMLSRIDNGAMSSGTKRALAYIYANLSEPIRLIDIAHHSKVNERTLQKGFQRAFGMTPMQVLRGARLDSARYFLTVRRNRLSVADAAYTNGFSHLGRFSRDYKKRFGHLPSEDCTEES
ncbi:AraC family transcriptional regulator [Ahrensia sp. 13_GOM-1096m]|uniref:AraC family transcriptional regulator n=1 Tax=Ahrensia sp. 13_GOM-1096m TaxID=1380380 RepID=UPI00047D7F88|nr:AraC family transcriptional regulator [Ahrensia sp. 13_GOM-1096m]